MPKPKTTQEAKQVILSKREISILNALYLADFLTADQLRLIFFPNHSHSGSWHHFNKLSQQGFITKETFIENRKKRWVLWYLTKDGIRHLLETKGYKNLSNMPNVREIKPAQINHDFHLSQIFVDLVKSSENYDAVMKQIIWSPFCERHLKFNPKKKYDQRRNSHQTYYDFIYPDVIFESSANGHKVYLELDMGTKGKSRIIDDLKSYAQYFKETDEQSNRGVFLMYSVKNEDRRKFIYDTLEESKCKPSFANFRCRIYGQELTEKLNDIINWRSHGK